MIPWHLAKPSRVKLLIRTGELNPQCKVSDRGVIEMRAIYRTGCFYQWELAAAWGCSQNNVSRICRGRRTKTSQRRF